MFTIGGGIPGLYWRWHTRFVIGGSIPGLLLEVICQV